MTADQAAKLCRTASGHFAIADGLFYSSSNATHDLARPHYETAFDLRARVEAAGWITTTARDGTISVVSGAAS